jgi:hypothetical protein
MGGTSGGMGGGYGSNTSGPHGSDMANRADPRIDSDMDGSRTMGGSGGMRGTGNQPGMAHTGGHAPGSGMGGDYGSSATPGSGNAANAGPHNSKMMNQLDPRVDSDMDGSKTAGGNATYR